jgi:hypothetical protein
MNFKVRRLPNATGEYAVIIFIIIFACRQQAGLVIRKLADPGCFRYVT